MPAQDLKKIGQALGAQFAERAAHHDATEQFVSQNYEDLKEKRIFSALVPEDLGGGGASLTETCELLFELGQHCASTALALSMHTHLVAATVFKHMRGQPGAKLLEKVARDQAVLVSTGATDWIDSNGEARRVEGGYRVSGRKVFGSGSPAADLLITTFAANEEPEGPCVIHCPVPLNAEGVEQLDDWHTLGMRGTGSHSVVLRDVFVPEASVALKRPQGQWHAAWDVVLGVAPPLFMAAYAGLANAAADHALAHAKSRGKGSLSQVLAVGQLENARTSALLAWRDMVRLAADLKFTPSVDNSSAQLVRKTLLTRAVKQTVELAVEVAGGAGFYRNLPFERLWRDAQAAHYHPLPENRQVVFTGRNALGLDRHWEA